MKFRDSVKTAYLGLRHAKIRSLLTMLGIVIGIGSVILLMAIGTSAQTLILNQVQGIGSNLIFIIPGGSSGSRFSAPASLYGIVINTLVKQDLDAFRREPTVAKAAPTVHAQARIVYGNNDASVTIDGTTSDFFTMITFGLERGNFFTDADVNSYNHVVVLGDSIAKTLFGGLDPMGKTVRIKNLSFTVIGILEPKGRGPFGSDFDNFVGIPVTVVQRQLAGIDYYNAMTVQASGTYNIDFTKARITSILRQDHHITDPNKDDFTIRTQQDAVDLLGSITSILTLFLTSIAAISLLVGGIGIMNIMLVSVVERTKEIGLRKAVGATNRDVLQQFLLEAMMLTFFGGLIGIIIGSLTDIGLYFILEKFLSTGWAFALPLSAILLAAGVSTFIGIVFGLYPARQAARKSPIEALRYE